MMNEWKSQFLNALPKRSLYLIQGVTTMEPMKVNNSQFFITKYITIDFSVYHLQHDLKQHYVRSISGIQYFVGHHYRTIQQSDIFDDKKINTFDFQLAYVGPCIQFSDQLGILQIVINNRQTIKYYQFKSIRPKITISD